MSALLLAFAAGGVLLLALAGIIYMLGAQNRKVIVPIGADVHVPMIRNFGPKESQHIVGVIRRRFVEGKPYQVWRSGRTAEEAMQCLKEEVEAQRLIFPPELEASVPDWEKIHPVKHHDEFQVSVSLTFSIRQSVA